MKRKLIAAMLAVMLLALSAPVMAENAAAGEGYMKQTVPIFRAELTDETATVRYFTDAPSIAYMSIADYYAIMLPGQTMQVESAGDGKYTLTSACGSALADIQADTLYSDDYSAFTKQIPKIGICPSNVLTVCMV